MMMTIEKIATASFPAALTPSTKGVFHFFHRARNFAPPACR
jgi:hypothetical protein